MENASWLSPPAGRVFATTRWSVVRACRDSDQARAREALAELCRSYWQPVYACIRHNGHSAQDAEDLTQDFFLKLLNERHLEEMDQAKGRFRAYLSTVLGNFLRDRWRRKWTWARGRGVTIVPIESLEAERSYGRFRNTEDTPETLYERHWALAVIQHALDQLKFELAADRKEAFLEHFEAILTAEIRAFPYEDLARKMKLTVATLHVALHRWRRRFRLLLREEISRTVLSKADIDDEMEHLLECVRRR